MADLSAVPLAVQTALLLVDQMAVLSAAQMAVPMVALSVAQKVPQ